MRNNEWLCRARKQLQYDTELLTQETDALHLQCLEREISQLEDWIAEFEVTGNIPGSAAYEMVMGNE